MREYKIKKNHNPDLNMLILKYFNVKGDVLKGVKFEISDIGKIEMRNEKDSLFINIEPPKKISGNYNIIKKWNDFLFEATGKSSKERKKEFGKV